MTHLLAAADQPVAGLDWGALAVAFIAGVSAIAVAFWNTRGETSALRRLKAMNEALDNLPKGESVTEGFAAARNLLAERIARRVTGPSFWKRFGMWILGVVVGVATVAGFSWLMAVLWPDAGETESLGFIISVTGLGTAAAALVATAPQLARRDRERRAREEIIRAFGSAQGQGAETDRP